MLVIVLLTIPVSVNKTLLSHESMSLGHATQQQKLQSRPRFGAFKADFPTRHLIQRSDFFRRSRQNVHHT